MKNKAAARASLRSLIVGAVALAAVFALSIALLMSWVLKAPVGRERPEVTVTMPRTGGLFEGSAATYRGVEVGRVTKIDLGADGVEVTVRLDPGRKVPRKSAAKVRSLSPVGEQYLDFRPEARGGPYLVDGDRLTAQASDLPVSIAKMVSGLQGALRQVDPDKVRIVLREVNAAFEGSGEDLSALVENTEVLLQTIDTTLPQIERVLLNGRTTLQIFADNREVLRSFAVAAASVGTWYLTWDPTVQKILTKLPADLKTVTTLLTKVDKNMPDFLAEVNQLTKILALHGPHLEATLAMTPYGLGRFASVMRNGYMNVVANLNGQRTCDYGVSRRNPTHTARQAPGTEGRCGSGAPWRSAEHAPGPLTR
ncbi:MCE family protein [Nocardioides sp. Bht2]|uniref:MCE family protein n=1 Tax=Nocardioides sp. Bht2 TaxID=3392297 RepID=UPI0039B5C7DF